MDMEKEEEEEEEALFIEVCPNYYWRESELQMNHWSHVFSNEMTLGICHPLSLSLSLFTHELMDLDHLIKSFGSCYCFVSQFIE